MPRELEIVILVVKTTKVYNKKKTMVMVILMIKIAFCDDNPDVISQIDSLMPDMKLSTTINWDMFGSGEELVTHLKGAYDVYNIYVLDIEMPGLDGINVAKKIRENDKTAVLIFLTDHKEYVYQVFEVLPFRFLEKPVESGRLQKALMAAIEHLQTVNTLFFFQVGHQQMQWPVGDIKYFESTGRKVTLYATKEQFSFYAKCDEIYKRLDQFLFTRPHASYIVNQEFVRSIKQDEIIVADEIVIPISKRYRMRFKQDHMLFVERRSGII